MGPQGKYLHFLFGRVEIQRGQRLQKLFFLVPAAIRTLKGQSLIKDRFVDQNLGLIGGDSGVWTA